MRLKHTEAPWSLDICVRVFAEEIDPVVEYRAFAVGVVRERSNCADFAHVLFQAKLTACSQYIHDVFCEEILANQEPHAHAIQKLWNELVLKTKIAEKYAAMVVDFAIMPNGDAIVVELNPFDDSTDACLFNWTIQKTLLNKGPEVPKFKGTTFAWQIVEGPGKATKTQERWWRKILESV